MEANVAVCVLVFPTDLKQHKQMKSFLPESCCILAALLLFLATIQSTRWSCFDAGLRTSADHGASLCGRSWYLQTPAALRDSNKMRKGRTLHENGELRVFAQLLIYSSFFYFFIWKSAGVWTGECMARMCVFLNIYSVTLSVMNSVLSHARNVPAVPTHPLTCPTSHYCLGL